MSEKVDLEKIAFSPEVQAAIADVKKRLENVSRLIGRNENLEIWGELGEGGVLKIIFKLPTAQGQALGALEVPAGHWQKKQPMVIVTATSGRFQGVSRCFAGARILMEDGSLGEEINPAELFSGFMHHGDFWSIDYSQANPEDVRKWGVADISARIFRALDSGRTVKFMDHEWSWKAEGPSLIKLVEEIENTIVNSGFIITLLSDDEDGVVIDTSGLE